MNPSRKRILKRKRAKANKKVSLTLPSTSKVVTAIVSKKGQAELNEREIRGKILMDESYKISPEKMQTIYGI